MLDRFIRGEDRSSRFAAEIETMFVEVFPNDERFTDVLLALASYEPGGGELLYDEKRILPTLQWARSQLVSKQ